MLASKRLVERAVNYRDLFQPGPTELLGSTAVDLRHAVISTLASKSPEQHQKIVAQLLRFSGDAPDLTGRVDEFASVFPLHPDALAVFERIRIPDSPRLLTILANAINEVLGLELPEAHAGLIGFDLLWQKLANDPEAFSTTEFQTISKTVTDLESLASKNFGVPNEREAAVRLVRSLGLHWLAGCESREDRAVSIPQLEVALRLTIREAALRLLEPAEQASVALTAIVRELQRLDRSGSLLFDPLTQLGELQPAKFQRFVRPEVLMHWVNALPFLVLMLTGAVTMTSRFHHINAFILNVVRIIHLTAATSWLIGMPLVVALSFKVHSRNIRTMLTWKKEDVIWLVQSLRGLLNWKATLSPVGRFNAGQKINACLVMLYFVGFGISGALMYFKESILVPWYIHAALFFATIASVGGHLYLSLINRSTRKSLPGIIDGWTPLEYVEHHHPLSLPPALRRHDPDRGTGTLWQELALARTELLTLVAVFLMAGIGVFAFQRGQLATIKQSFAKSFTDFITPNQLSTKHRIGPTAESCVKCHEYAGEIPDAKCEQCHLDIKQRHTLAMGYHGTLTGDCKHCHPEHPNEMTNSVILFRPEKFNHDLAAYKLTGKHTTVSCDACHKAKHPPKVEGVTEGIYYIGLKFAACTDCHPDLHNGQLAANCEQCHSTSGWQGANLKFSHDTDSQFPLAGKHKTTDCVKCHQPKVSGSVLGTAPFKGVARECLGCHKDPHRGELPTQCTPCHTASGWVKENLTFDHDKASKYPLEGKHATTKCEQCHLPSVPGEALGLAKFRGLKTGCPDCHQDPHRGQFEANCTSCHPSPKTWSVDAQHFDHNRDSKFPLEGAHLQAKCVACHKPESPAATLGTTKFKGLPTACEDCHQIKHPDKHPAAFGRLCVSCHNTIRWGERVPDATHIQIYAPLGQKLLGKHLAAECRTCHRVDLIPRLGLPCPPEQQCSICHQATDPHHGTLGLDCYRCHTTLSWLGPDLRFDHNTMTKYPLDQNHEHVACVACHENQRWKPTPKECKVCHPNRF